MTRYLFPLAALLLVGACIETPAEASPYTYSEGYYVPPEHVHWHIDTGFAATVGPISDYLNGGWSFGGGLTWQPDFSSPLALRADVGFSYFGATRQLIAINQAADQMQIDDGYGEMFGLAVDGEYRMPLSPTLTAYTLAGVGFEHRRIALTQTVALGDYFCDPFFGFCEFGVVPGQVAVASNDTTRFAWNAGLGLDVRLGGGESFFVEARYLRLQTADSEEFVPISVGLRF